MPSKIWIDLDNTPHAPFFKPIIEALKSKGHHLIVTTRRMPQLCELADKYEISNTSIGNYAGKSKLRKISSLLTRSIGCYWHIKTTIPDIAISHGARSQLLTANLLKIPTIEFIDYEHIATPPGCTPKWEIAPNCYPRNIYRVPNERALAYPGIKEDVYACGFTPSHQTLRQLKISRDKIIVTLRPPANEAHYHNKEADLLFKSIMERLISNNSVHTIVVPRSPNQKQTIIDSWNRAYEKKRITIPQKAVDGLDLIWESDLVIGGGGTMTREAAALNVPAYSFFRGPMGAVDSHLVVEQRLTMLENTHDVQSKISFQKRKIHDVSNNDHTSLNSVTRLIEEIIQTEMET